MSNYFPNRNPAQGFSVTSIASKVKERLVNDPYRNIKQKVMLNRTIPSSIESHWANRTYEEYKDAA